MSEMPPPMSEIPPSSGTPASSDRTIMLVLSYLGLFALIPLLIKKDDKEIQWHAKNGLAIAIAYIIIIIAWTFGNTFLPSSIGCALSFVGCGLWIGYIVLIIFAIMKAMKGERLRVPVISDFADKM